MEEVLSVTSIQLQTLGPRSGPGERQLYLGVKLLDSIHCPRPVDELWTGMGSRCG